MATKEEYIRSIYDLAVVLMQDASRGDLAGLHETLNLLEEDINHLRAIVPAPGE